jgi:hypothetical protein
MEKKNRLKAWTDFALDPSRGDERAGKFLDAVSTFDRKAYGAFVLAIASDEDGVGADEILAYANWTDEQDAVWLKYVLSTYGRWPLPPGSAFLAGDKLRKGNNVRFRVRSLLHFINKDDEALGVEKVPVWVNVSKTTRDDSEGAWWDGASGVDMEEAEQTGGRIRGPQRTFYTSLGHRMESQYPKAMGWLLRFGWKGPEHSLDDDGRGLVVPIILQQRRKRAGLGYVSGGESQNKEDEDEDGENEDGEESYQKEVQPRQLQKFVHSESSDRGGMIYDATNEDGTVLYFVDANCNRLTECPRWSSSGELTRAIENNNNNLGGVFTPAEAARRAQWARTREFSKSQVQMIQQGLVPQGTLTSKGRRALARIKVFGSAHTPVPTPDTAPTPNTTPMPARVRAPAVPPTRAARPPARLPIRTTAPGPVQQARNPLGNTNVIARVENAGWVPPHMRGAGYVAQLRQDGREAVDDLADRMEGAKIND